MSATNGTATQRKTLSSQLDRLDTILDGLSEGLNEAVRDAVREAVGEAVQVSVRETLHTLLRELVCNPDLIQSLRAMAVPAQPHTMTEDPVPPATEQPAPGRWTARFRSWVCPFLVSKWAWVKRMAQSGQGWLKVLRHHCWSVLSLTGIGLVVGVGSYFLGPILSAIFAGLGGASIAVLIVAGLALRRACGIGEEVNAAW